MITKKLLIAVLGIVVAFGAASAALAPSTVLADGMPDASYDTYGYSPDTYDTYGYTPSYDSYGSTPSYDTSDSYGYTPSYDTYGYTPTYDTYGSTPSYDTYGYTPDTYDTYGYTPSYDTYGYTPSYDTYAYTPSYDTYGYTPSNDTYDTYGYTPSYDTYGYTPSYDTYGYTGGYDDIPAYSSAAYDDIPAYSSGGYDDIPAYSSGGSYYQQPYNYNYGGSTTYVPPSYTYNYTYTTDTTTYHHDNSCADYGMEGSYPNCHQHQNPQCQSGYTGSYPNCYPPHTPTCADSGQEGTYPDCHQHHNPTCADSNQEGTYPNCHPHQNPTCADQGLEGTYPNCHQHQYNTPVCDISADDTSIDDNESTVLHWTSENADQATLSPGGSVATGGSRTVSPNDDTTYTLHVTGQGGSDTCSVTVNVHERNNNLSCDLTASDRNIQDGDDTVLRWSVDGNADYASINHGVGRVDEQDGTERVSPSSDTTYTLTVRDNDGNEDTCSTSINVDDNNNFSSVAFTGEPPSNPPVVYLSSIPYTGLEDIDPVLLTYWALLIAAAGMGAWFLYSKGLIPNFAFASAEPSEGHADETIEEGHGSENPAVTSFLASLTDGNTSAAVDEVRAAAARGESVEDFLAEAATATDDAELQARVNSALEAAKLTGVRGVKASLA